MDGRGKFGGQVLQIYIAIVRERTTQTAPQIEVKSCRVRLRTAPVATKRVGVAKWLAIFKPRSDAIDAVPFYHRILQPRHNYVAFSKILSADPASRHVWTI